MPISAAGLRLASRKRADAQHFFADREIMGPGVVPVMTWHRDGASGRPAHSNTSGMIEPNRGDPSPALT